MPAARGRLRSALMLGAVLATAGGGLLAARLHGAGKATLPPDSVCRGTPSAGRLEQPGRLPMRGVNFQAYGRAGVVAGRTHAHVRAVRANLEAYAALAEDMPDAAFVYGESGHADGGPFPPHRTHQNGTSMDFMVPVRDRHGRSVPLPGHAGNRYGYDLEFDAQGRWRAGTDDELRIDFEALGAHLHALARSGRAHGAPIARVILAPEYLPLLFATRHGPALLRSLHFTRGKVWWRHGENYHIDFRIPCEPLR